MAPLFLSLGQLQGERRYGAYATAFALWGVPRPAVPDPPRPRRAGGLRGDRRDGPGARDRRHLRGRGHGVAPDRSAGPAERGLGGLRRLAPARRGGARGGGLPHESRRGRRPADAQRERCRLLRRRGGPREGGHRRAPGARHRAAATGGRATGRGRRHRAPARARGAHHTRSRRCRWPCSACRSPTSSPGSPSGRTTCRARTSSPRWWRPRPCSGCDRAGHPPRGAARPPIRLGGRRRGRAAGRPARLDRRQRRATSSGSTSSRASRCWWCTRLIHGRDRDGIIRGLARLARERRAGRRLSGPPRGNR